MTNLRRFGVLFTLALSAGPLTVCPAQAQEMVTVPVEIAAYPDMIVYNGKIATMDDRSTQPTPGTFVQAMAIRGGQIAALGSDERILLWAGPETWQIDLGGKTVIPSIIDAHTHIHNHALTYWLSQNPHVIEEVARNYSVDGESNQELKHNLVVLIKERVQPSEPGKWAFIRLPGGGGSGTGRGVRFLQDRQITLEELDELAPENPILLEAHPARIMNTAAKKAINKMYRSELTDEVDETGFINDTNWYGRALIVDGYFRDKTAQLAEIIRDGMLKQAAVGITTFSSHIMGVKFSDAFVRLDREKRMPIRFAYTHYSGFPANPDPAEFYLRMGDMAGVGSDYFWQSAVGLGSVDSGPPRICTSMDAPAEVKAREWCKNTPGSITSEAIYTSIMAGQRVALGHSYGDRPVDFFMDNIERAMRDSQEITLEHVHSRRFSADHCGFYPRADQIPRIAQLGMIISCDAGIINRSYPWLQVYGMQYANRIAPVKSMMEGGVKVVMEEEVRVESGSGPTYFASFIPYLNRKTRAGNLVAPQEAVDRVQVLKMATAWASEYVLKEDKIGTLEKGKLADFLVLNKDFFTVPELELASVFPLMTVVGGKVVVLRREFGEELNQEPVGPQIRFEAGAGRRRE